jgi:hypothetical protein
MAFRDVTIKFKASGKNEDLTITPSLIRMRGAGWGEQIRWTGSGRVSSFRIDFNYPDGSPFGAQSTFTSVNNVATSPTPTVSGAAPIAFAYTITAQLSAQGSHRARQVVIDPEVEVDDGTPPPSPTTSGKKKAAKKRASKKRSSKKAARKTSRKRRR